MLLEVFSTLMIPWFSQYLFNLICLVSTKLYLGLKELRINQLLGGAGPITCLAGREGYVKRNLGREGIGVR